VTREKVPGETSNGRLFHASVVNDIYARGSVQGVWVERLPKRPEVAW
jgi:hypothetical protein